MPNYPDSYITLIRALKLYADGHHMVRRFGHGQMMEADLESSHEFPLMWVAPESFDWPTDGKTRTYGLRILFADLPLDTDGDYRERCGEVISDMKRLAEDLLGTMRNGEGPWSLQRGAVRVTSASATPFIDERQNKLTGVELSLTVQTPYVWDACDVPATWNLNAPGDPSGGGGGVAYWGTFAVSGETDVDADTAFDTVTFEAGPGMNIDTTPASKKITFQSSLPFVIGGGTVANITANFSPDIELTDGLVICVQSPGANVDENVFVAVDGGANLRIKKRGDHGLVCGDIPSDDYFMLLAYHLDVGDDHWELLNPALDTTHDKSVVDSSALTGSLTETVMHTITFDPGTVKAGDIIQVVARWRKTGVLGTHAPRMRIGTTGLSATLAASGSTTGSNVWNQMSRIFVVKDSTTIEAYPASSLSGDDVVQATTAATNITVDLAGTGFQVYLTSQLGNAADSVVLSSYFVKKI